MPHRIDTGAVPRPVRRAVLLGLAAAALLPALPAGATVDDADALADLERRSGGRLGAFALDTGSGRSLAHRADERFLMCSTTKLASVAAVLARVDAGSERLDRRVPYTAAGIAVGYAPDTKAHLADGGMTLEALCRAAIVHSDNGAANLLFESLGGPGAVTRFARGLGDPASRFDRIEPALNRPDGERDTTTPRAFATLTRALLLGDALSPASRALLDGWTIACETGGKRIRAGVPKGWTVGDKTGTAGPVADDVALLRPPNRAPIVVAAYCDAPGLDDDAREAVLREVGAIAAKLAA
jgi:beta-lactamase class A